MFIGPSRSRKIFKVSLFRHLNLHWLENFKTIFHVSYLIWVNLLVYIFWLLMPQLASRGGPIRKRKNSCFDLGMCLEESIERNLPLSRSLRRCNSSVLQSKTKFLLSFYLFKIELNLTIFLLLKICWYENKQNRISDSKNRRYFYRRKDTLFLLDLNLSKDKLEK